MNTETQKAIKEMSTGLRALYLEVDRPIAQDLEKRFNRVLEMYQEGQRSSVKELRDALDACFGVMMQPSYDPLPNGVTAAMHRHWTVGVNPDVFLEARRKAEIMYYEAIKSQLETPKP